MDGIERRLDQTTAARLSQLERLELERISNAKIAGYAGLLALFSIGTGLLAVRMRASLETLSNLQRLTAIGAVTATAVTSMRLGYLCGKQLGQEKAEPGILRALHAGANQANRTNLDLAIDRGNPSIDKSLLSVNEAQSPQLPPASFKVASITDEGQSKGSNQDTHFTIVLENGGRLLGVVDGHGAIDTPHHEDLGLHVAKRSSELFQEKFARALKEHHKWPVDVLMQHVCREVQQQLVKEYRAVYQEIYHEAGAVAVFSFIPPDGRVVYTATIGDSQAQLLRKDSEGRWIAIPLSVVEEWSDEEAYQRAVKVKPDLKEKLEWSEGATDEEKKNRRFEGVAPTRSFGEFAKSAGGLIQDPIVTATPLKSGDRLLLTCDGVDFIDDPTDKSKTYKGIELVANIVPDFDQFASSLIEQAKEGMVRVSVRGYEASIDKLYEQYLANYPDKSKEEMLEEEIKSLAMLQLQNRHKAEHNGYLTENNYNYEIANSTLANKHHDELQKLEEVCRQERENNKRTLVGDNITIVALDIH